MAAINWTRPKLERFKTAFEAALKQKGDTFSFDGNEFVKGYAKYLIEYLESVLAR